jgi:membrane-associated protease RseP (regulator of RpoE activity)
VHELFRGLSETGLRLEFTSPPEIIGVDAGGPAARAGIKVGDVILTVDGESLTKKRGADRLFNARPGTTLRIGFQRGALRKEVTIRVGSVSDAEASGTPSGRTQAGEASSSAEPTAGAPVRFSGNLDQFSIEVRGSPNVHVVMPLDDSWMDIISRDIRVKIRRIPGK